MSNYKIGQSWRTKDGAGRVSYRPDWDSVLPFMIYVRGTARIHKGTLAAWCEWLWDNERLVLNTGDHHD